LVNDFPKVDAVVIAHTLLNWDDEVKSLLVKKSFEALSPGGALLVVDYFLDSDRKNSAPSHLVSVNMIFVTEGHC